MTHKPTKGWAGIVDFEDEDTPVDNVVPEHEPKAPAPNLSPAKQAGPAPVPPRTEARQALRLPSTGQPKSAARPVATPPPSGASSPTFSHQELVEKLTDLHRPEPSTATSGKGVWMEYRELFVTGGVGALLLASVFAYRALDKSEPSSAGVVAASGPQSRPIKDAGFAADAKTGALEVAPPATDPEPTPPPSKAAIPMASIVSDPKGATVEIEGEVLGKTPLILPAPKGRTSLHVRLVLPGRVPWQGVVEANEGGHFVVNQTLEPGR